MKLFFLIKLTIMFFLYYRINSLHHDICIIGRHLNDNKKFSCFVNMSGILLLIDPNAYSNCILRFHGVTLTPEFYILCVYWVIHLCEILHHLKKVSWIVIYCNTRFVAKNGRRESLITVWMCGRQSMVKIYIKYPMPQKLNKLLMHNRTNTKWSS